MPNSGKQSIMACKVDERTKRRFDAAMRAHGTTTSECFRAAVLRFLDEVDAGVEHPQFRIDLGGEEAERDTPNH